MAKSISRRHMLCLTAATVGSTALVGGTHARATEQPGRSRRPAGTQPAQMPPAEPGKDYTPVITPNGWTLPYKLMDGVKVFHLIAEPVQHEFAPGLVCDCWGYMGTTPGPTIEVVEGTGARLRPIACPSPRASTGTASCRPMAWTVWRATRSHRARADVQV
jgi:FtsP/CotA-like multicopper oxidase with cupredoxin domain